MNILGVQGLNVYLRKEVLFDLTQAPSRFYTVVLSTKGNKKML